MQQKKKCEKINNMHEMSGKKVHLKKMHLKNETHKKCLRVNELR